MNLEGILYQPKLIIQLTVADVGLLITCSELHYDGTCKAAGRSGGFLRGWKNRVQFAEDSKDTIPVDLIVDFKTCDLVAKITEQFGGNRRNKDITALHTFFSNCCHVINQKYREANKNESFTKA